MSNLYVTYDTISEEFSTPWVAKNDNVARRNLMIASKRENLLLNDIKLYCVGCYNESEGNLYDCNCDGLILPTIEIQILTDNQNSENLNKSGSNDSKE